MPLVRVSNGGSRMVEVWMPSNAGGNSPLCYANSSGTYTYNAGTYSGLLSSSTSTSSNTRFAFTATKKCKATFTVNGTALYVAKDFAAGESMMTTYSYVGGGSYSLIVWE
jgi:hypothetical protein